MRTSVRFAAAMLLLLLACAPVYAQGRAQVGHTQMAGEDSRGLVAAASASMRHAIVKAVGKGRTANEAERAALKSARALAAARYARLGGAAALDPDPGHERVLAMHHSPPLGFAEIRATVLVEIPLRRMAEPLPSGPATEAPLPALTARLESGSVVVEGTPAMEVALVVEHPGGQAPDQLPGGGGGAWRLVPGRPLRQPLPEFRNGSRLHVLACTGGLSTPASAESAEEALLRARAGKPRPAAVEGVISECVQRTLRLGPASPPAQLSRSLEVAPAEGTRTGF